MTKGYEIAIKGDAEEGITCNQEGNGYCARIRENPIV
jgi:hypothetical protein